MIYLGRLLPVDCNVLSLEILILEPFIKIREAIVGGLKTTSVITFELLLRAILYPDHDFFLIHFQGSRKPLDIN